jgi:hypothetical protein
VHAAVASVYGALARVLPYGEVGADIRLHLHAVHSFGAASMPQSCAARTHWAAQGTVMR